MRIMFVALAFMFSALFIVPAPVAKDDDVEHVDLAAGELLKVTCDYNLVIRKAEPRDVQVFCEPKPTSTPKATKTATPQSTSTNTPQATVVATNVPTSVPTSAPSSVPTNVPTSEATATPVSGVRIIPPGANLGDVINNAENGASLQLSDGEYNGSFTINKSVFLFGSPNAVIKGTGRVIQITSDNVHLEGFTVRGGDIGIFAGSRTAGKPLVGLQLRKLTVQNMNGECVRLRYLVQNAFISNNTIGPCGQKDFPNGVYAGGGKNGEGIYIGTAPEQRGDGKNPDSRVDESNNNRVVGNVFNTQGNECVDIKEGASGNVIENNSCTGQKDENSGGFDSRGNGNIFRNNTVFDNLGAGIRFGGDTAQDGINNEAYNNVIENNKKGGIKFQAQPQAKICGNTMNNNTGGNSVGTYASQYDPTRPCQ